MPACGQALMASGAEEGGPLGKGTEQVTACCDLNDLAELLRCSVEGESSMAMGHRESLGFMGHCLVGWGTTAMST